jgi:hypothetical protein
MSIGPLGPRWGITAVVAGQVAARQSPHKPPADRLLTETQSKAPVLIAESRNVDVLNPDVTC